MHLNQKITTFILCFLLIIGFGTKSFSQSEAEKRAMYLFNIAYNVTWEDQKDIGTFTIGVFSDEDEFAAIEMLAKERAINKMPVEVIKYEKNETIKEHHIIYVTKSENANLAFVYEKFKGKNVLIFSDRSKEPQYSVINFRKLKDGVQMFDINSKVAEEQSLKLSQQILKLGGNREDIQKIYADVHKKLIYSDKRIKELEKQLKEKDEIILELKKKLEEK